MANYFWDRVSRELWDQFAIFWSRSANELWYRFSRAPDLSPLQVTFVGPREGVEDVPDADDAGRLILSLTVEDAVGLLAVVDYAVAGGCVV